MPLTADEDIRALLTNARTIAMVGASDRPDRPSYGVMKRLQDHGAELMAPLRETPFERFFFRDPNGYVFEVIDEQGYLSSSQQ